MKEYSNKLVNIVNKLRLFDINVFIQELTKTIITMLRIYETFI